MSTRLDWLKERQTVIGGSDAPVLLGFGFDGQTAADLWRQKTAPMIENRPTGALRLGIELEPLVGQLYEEQMGVPVDPCGLVVVRHPLRPWQGCTPDFRRADGMYMQAKTVGFFSDEWGPSGSDEIPDGYRLQVTQEMACTGTDMIDLAALCRMSGELRVYRLTFDQVLWEWLTEIEARFWECVERRQPPPADWHQQLAGSIDRVIVRGKSIVLGDDVAAKVEQRRAIKAIKDEADAWYERLGEEIKEAMGDAEEAVAGGFKLKQTHVKESTFTTTRKSYSYVKATPIKERIGR